MLGDIHTEEQALQNIAQITSLNIGKTTHQTQKILKNAYGFTGQQQKGKKLYKQLLTQAEILQKTQKILKNA